MARWPLTVLLPVPLVGAGNTHVRAHLPSGCRAGSRSGGTVMGVNDAVVFCDVDGVVSALPVTPDGAGPPACCVVGAADPWGDARVERIWGLEVPLSQRLFDRLAALPATLVWATTWGAAANKLGANVGWEPLEALVWPKRPVGWSKLAAVCDWVTGERPGRFVWCDDHLVDHADAVLAAVAALGVPALLICPHRHTGLTPDHLELIEAFLADPAPAGVRLEAAAEHQAA